jgi:hypothetical protein
MNAELIQEDGGVESYKVTNRASPLLLILTTVAFMLAVQTGTVLMTMSLSLILTGLLAVNLLCGVWLFIVCADFLAPQSIRMSADGITHARLITSTSYPWDDISALKIVAASGSLSDAPRDDGRGRIGVGVILREDAKTGSRDERNAAKVTTPGQTPKVKTAILIGGDRQHAEKMMEIIEHIKAFQQRQIKPVERWRKSAQQPQQQQQFRKKPNITMPGAV